MTVSRDEAVAYLGEELRAAEQPVVIGVTRFFGVGPDGENEDGISHLATQANVDHFAKRATILRMAIASLMTESRP